jgi:hypothetical protein
MPVLAVSERCRRLMIDVEDTFQFDWKVASSVARAFTVPAEVAS